MPSRSRSVSFEATPLYSRQPYDDEKYVMKAFSRHCAHCSQCSNPYAVHRAGGTLCDKGHRRALDVAQYVYSQAGTAYSLVDRETHQHVQLEIPAGCEAVRSLLKALDRGLRLMRSQHTSQPLSRDSSVHSDSSHSNTSRSSSRSSSSPYSSTPASYDRTYYVAPRVSSSKPERRESHRVEHKSEAERRAERRERAKGEENHRRRHRKSHSDDREHEDSWPRTTVRSHRSSSNAPHPHSDRHYYNYNSSSGYYSFPNYEPPRSGLISVW